MKKSQTMGIFFFLFLVIVSSILLTFFHKYFGISYEEELLDIKKIDTARNVIESFKAFSLLSLEYSAQQTLREGACTSGTITTGAWICNNPTPPDIKGIIDCHNKYITYYFSVYLDKFNISLPLNFKIKHGNCEEKIDKDKIFDGEYDEGNFWIGCKNLSISVYSEDLANYEEFNISLFLTKNRFWYLFRNFYEWALKNVYGKCICECTSSCQGCECVKKCAKLALEDLKQRFDENVSCKIEEKCCYRELGEICLPPSDCLTWKNPKKCKVGLCGGPFCEILKQKKELCKPKKIRVKKGGIRLLGESNKEENSITCYSEIWQENKISATHTYSCEDYKYFIPSDKGPIPLIFKVTAHARWKDHDACRWFIECECPKDAKDCSECKQTGCTKCVQREK